MSQQLSRQIALISVLASCALIVTLVIAAGLNADTGTALAQAFPLALICSVGLALLISEPTRSR